MANQYPPESKKNRDKARAEGKKRYLSATPCKKCGTYERYVSTYGCCKCVVEAGLKKLADKELMAPGDRPIEIVDGGKVIEEVIA